MNFNITQWLNELTDNLNQVFGDRILFIGHIGSYARGEANEKSDIDVNIILDTLSLEDLHKYRKIIKNMPFSEKACGFICGKEEIEAWPKHELFQFMQGCKTLYGSMSGIIQEPSKSDITENIRNTVSAIYHDVCHRYIFCDSIENEVDLLQYGYKTAFFILQEWVFLEQNVYVPTKNKLLGYLRGENKEILDICMNWENLTSERKKRPEYYFSVIKSWCSNMLKKLPI